MYKVQYRRVGNIDEDSLNRMSGVSMESRHSKNWDSWNIGEFTVIEHAMKSIDPMYGKVVEKFHLGCVIYWFKEAYGDCNIQIRFVHYRERKPKESPWKIGLNDV